MKYLILALYSISSLAYGQSTKDSILMLNGKVYKGEVIGLEEGHSDSVLTFTDEKGEKTSFETYRIFSYTSKGLNNVIYRPDEFKGNFLGVSETKAVTYGSFDARHTFKPHFVFWSSYALGLGASLSDTYLTKKEAENPNNVSVLEPGFFKRDPTWFPFLVPVVLTVTWALPSFKLKHKKVIHKEYYKNANYYRGYQRIAKQKRIFAALIGSFSGIATGMVTHYIAQ
jgi:hypothetical protein